MIAGAGTIGNRVAVVTGGNKGIGFHIALQLASSNLFRHVIVGCRDTGRGDAAVKDIQQQLQLQLTAGGMNNSKIDNNNVASVSCLPLELGNAASYATFRQLLQENFCQKEGSNNTIDLLVNNAATAFKGADPTPFEQQTKPTLDINFRATVDFTEEVMIPLMTQKTSTSTDSIDRDVRIVNVASMSGRLGQLKSEKLRQTFTSPELTMPELHSLMNDFEQSVQDGSYAAKGFGSSNYGMSKLAIIAATKIWARELGGGSSDGTGNIKVNCCCPGYCATDMSSHNGPRSASDGAKNAVLLATMPRNDCPTGAFYQNMEPSDW
jgi:carbonyl reductase 1